MQQTNITAIIENPGGESKASFLATDDTQSCLAGVPAYGNDCLIRAYPCFPWQKSQKNCCFEYQYF